MTAAVPLVERLAERLKLTHFDGNGCGTHGINACSVCHGPSPMSAREVAETLLPVVEQAVAEARGEVLREAAEAVRSAVSYGFELRPDGSEDPAAAVYVEGLRDAWQIVSDRADAIATTEGAP